MSPQVLPRSYKRKYKKLHAQFVAKQGSTILLEEDIKDATATALKLIVENDMLLDLLGDLAPSKTLSSLAQHTEGSANKSNNLDDLAAESTEASNGAQLTMRRQPDYEEKIPAHFEDMPWDLDRNSFSGSHLEDLARTIATSAGMNYASGGVDTPAATSSSVRKLAIRQNSTKKRERADGDDTNGLASGRKKKRKSMAVSNHETWES